MRYGWLLVIVELCGVSAALSATPSLPTFADRYDYTSCISTDTGNSVAAANFNGEGIPDLICTGLELFLGVGDGTIRIAHLHSTIGTLGSPQDLFALSVHGQNPKLGLPHLVVPDGSGVLDVILNTTK